MPSKFGQLLIWGKLITPDQLEVALKYQREHGGKLGQVLNQLGFVTDDDVTRTLGMKYGAATVNLDELLIEQTTLHLLPADMARKNRVIPLERVGSNLTCAMEDPTRVDIVDDVEFQTGFHVQPMLVTPSMMSAALERYYPSVTPSESSRPPAYPQPRLGVISDITNGLRQLSPDKLEYVRRFVDSLQ
jgi:type IV pilus assembly protein PilB